MTKDGILLIDKPRDHTSFDVVARLRGMLGVRKIGHSGTLDPMATGVLPILILRATKCCDILPNQDKTYRATLRLGVTTDTLDITGKVVCRRPVTAGKREVLAALDPFRGVIWQTPPMYSAVQVDGKRLYDLARQGREVERPRRQVEIRSLELLDSREEEGLYTLEVSCSKGTYIRSLCHDLGEALGCGAVLTQLRRTRAAGFSVEDCITIEEAGELASRGLLWDRVLPVEKAFEQLPQIVLSGRQARMFRNGVRLDSNRVEAPSAVRKGAASRIVSADGCFLAVGHIDPEREELICDKLFSVEGQAT